MFTVGLCPIYGMNEGGHGEGGNGDLEEGEAERFLVAAAARMYYISNNLFVSKDIIFRFLWILSILNFHLIFLSAGVPMFRQDNNRYVQQKIPF